MDAVDSGSVACLQVGAELPIHYDPRSPPHGQLAVGTRTYLDRNGYHFRTPVIGVTLLGVLAAWGARTPRSRRTTVQTSAAAAPS